MSPERKQLVLIVDDDQQLSDLMKVLLVRQGFAVHAVYGGNDALAWLRDNTPDAIILDIMMPDIDGFAVLRAVRADERTGLKPVIMLSARVDQKARDESMQAGADAYFSKPTPMTRLVEELREQMDRRRGDKAPHD